MSNSIPITPKPRVLLIGWDAADWIIINQLMDAGRMPHLARFVEQGVMGNLASLMPCLSPMLKTSAATGKTADQHGILGFVEAKSDGTGIIPSRSSTRSFKALWNMLDESDHRSCVVSWLVSDPVEPISGVYVSERIGDDLADRFEDIAAAPAGCVHPAALEPFVSELRLHPCELAPVDLSGMIPGIAGIDLNLDKRPEQVARLFARCATVHAVATATMEAEPWDFFAVYYDAIDRIGHDFMGYRAPRLDDVSEQDFEHYQHVIDGLYKFHDAMLGRLLELAGPDTTVILMSDHGFQSGQGRPASHGHSSEVPEDGADWHRMLGVLAMKGPGIKHDERIFGASILDITPTILSVFGLPVGRDMAGQVLVGAFVEPSQVDWIDSWENTGVAAARLSDKTATDLDAREASIRQLVALGYLDAGAIDGVDAARHADREGRFNLATVHMHHGRPQAALPILASLCQEVPLQPRYEQLRLLALSRLNRHADVLAELDRLDAAHARSAHFELIAASALAAQGDVAQALDCIERAALREPRNPIVHQLSGDFLLARGNLAPARSSFSTAIALDPDNAQAHAGLAQVELESGNFESAADSALTSLQQVFFNPRTQYCLGSAMAALGKRSQARRAYEHAIEQSPRFSEAHYRLAEMAEQDQDFFSAVAHRQKAIGAHP